MDYYTPIPKNDVPTKEFMSNDFNTRLVNVAEYFGSALQVEPVYFNKGLSKSPECYLRGIVVRKLEKALENLPRGITFLIYDGWRGYDTQRALYARYKAELREKYLEYSEEKLDELTQVYVSDPAVIPNNYFVHNTGGAVDLTLIDTASKAQYLMGTAFDDLIPQSCTAYYEQDVSKLTQDEIVIKNNRRMLYNVMVAAGFTNYPSEWWHFDYGNKLWSCYSGKPDFLTGIELTKD